MNGRLSMKSLCQDLVALLIQVIKMFDKIVDITGSYKVENIAETYMCCGGCPEKVNECRCHGALGVSGGSHSVLRCCPSSVAVAYRSV